MAEPLDPVCRVGKDTIALGDQEKMKYRKTWKSRSEEKVVIFSSATLFPARKQEAVTQGGTMLMGRKTQGASIIKCWEDKQDCRCIPDTFT